MNKEETLADIAHIKQMMEQSSTFLSLSGLSGIGAGLVGLLSIFLLSSWELEFLFMEEVYYGFRDTILFYVWASATLTISVLIAIFFTYRKAKKKKLHIWNKTAQRLIINLAIPLSVGTAFCGILALHGYYHFILPSTLLFYGLGLLHASKYTLHDVRYLGICEILLGLVSMLFFEYNLIFWGIGFGCMNIVYGALMYRKYETQN